MKQLKLITIGLFVSLNAIEAQERKENTMQANANLQHATIYFGNGVELSHSATANINKGFQEIVFNNVSTFLHLEKIFYDFPKHILT
jgi:hypothetical protein